MRYALSAPFAIALLVGAFASDSAAGTGGARSTRVGCERPTHSHLLTADASAEVFETSESNIYGCAYERGRAYLLGGRAAFSSSGGGGISEETIGGSIVAYEETFVSGFETPARWRVVVRDLRSGRLLHRFATGAATHHAAGFAGIGPTTEILVKSDGAVAWILESHFEPANVTNDFTAHREYEVEAADKAGNRLLASGAGVDPTSLALAGSALYWMQEGRPMSASLD